MEKRKSAVLRLLIVLAVISTVSQGFADPGPIRVATETWPPFRIPSGDSEAEGYTGIDMDILDILAERLDVTFTVRRMPWARCLDSMQHGKADVITGLAYTPERARSIWYTAEPYYYVFPVFYTAKGRGGLVRHYGDLQGLSIGYSLNSAYFEPFDSDAGLDKHGVPTEEQLLKMLVHGRLFLIIGTSPNMAYDVARMGFRDLVERTVYVPSQRTGLYLGISRQSRFMSRKGDVDAVMGELIRSGTIERIASRYF